MQAHFDARLLALGSDASVVPWPPSAASCYGPFLEVALGTPLDDADMAVGGADGAGAPQAKSTNGGQSSGATVAHASSAEVMVEPI